jgi:magnesium-transporting ATPase (P-type)
LLSARYLLAPALTYEGLTGNRLVVYAIVLLLIFQITFTYTPFMQRLFGTVALDLDHWLRIVLVAVSVLILVELEKWWLRKRNFKA